MEANEEALRREIKLALMKSEDAVGPKPENYEGILAILDEEMIAHEQRLPPPTQITAKHVRLLVTDEATGRIHLRALPIAYLENHNGITLTGENISAQEVKLAFLSAEAMERLAELQGIGPEKPRCNH